MDTKLIIDFFSTLRIHLVNTKQKRKADVCNNVINAIHELGNSLTLDSLKQKPGIGKSSIDKIKKVINGEWPCPISREKGQLIVSLENVYAIGPITARKLVLDKDVSSFEELKNRSKELLNGKQIIGVKYYEDLLQRIPRAEVKNHERYIMKTLEKIEKNIKNEEQKTIATVVGSYRRGKEDSGDIDVLFTGPDPEVVLKMIDAFGSYVLATLAGGFEAMRRKGAPLPLKFMGIVQLPNCIPRRLDMLYCPPNEYPFALLYFTGSKEYNTEVRSKANALGYTMNEHALTKIETGIKVNKNFKTEREIIEFLGDTWREPHER